ncbi:pilus assembly protein [Rubellimicrobium roseum]|uniref:Pilus assembly protein n=2 Tax=Rubellimicrobium roseum TaxID=687525 RepID=A0A5C4N495_9RHOB|nr:TadE family protein [Rubellimicrobium roseum]TNC58905.1 pilus assembly protein [Rubellimicrobium roseum]
MTAASRLRAAVRRVRTDESGTTLLELAMAIALFLLIFFALIDFGRMGYNWVMTQKAVQMAARIAAARPPACAGVPEANGIGTATEPYGTLCRNGAGICSTVDISCDGATANATVAEIWARVEPLLPPDATPANLRFRYSTSGTATERIGFLGGPFTPVVTVEAQNLEFQFVHPLAGLASLAGATDTTDQADAEANGIPMPSMSVSLPGEDLALGGAG